MTIWWTMKTINVGLINSFLVGGFKHFLFPISYMGCFPSHWRTPSFFKMVIAPPTSFYHHVTMKVAGVFGWKVGTLCVEDPHRSAPRWSKFWWFEGTTNCLMVWNHGFFSDFPKRGVDHHSMTGWWFGTLILFFLSVGNFIIPTDEVHHFLEGLAATTNQTVASKKPLVEASGASSLHRPQKVSPFPSQALQGFAFLRGKSEPPTH